jgi:hypothetical protein
LKHTTTHPNFPWPEADFVTKANESKIKKESQSGKTPCHAFGHSCPE